MRSSTKIPHYVYSEKNMATKKKSVSERLELFKSFPENTGPSELLHIVQNNV